MKKFFSLMLLCATVMLSFSSCSDDEKDSPSPSISKSQIVGTWDVTWIEEDGESTDVPRGYIYMTLNQDNSYRTTMLGNSYTGTYKINGNTVIGTTLDPITEYYKFTSLQGTAARIEYSNSVGDKYKFLATRR